MLAYLYSVAVGASGGDVITNISLSVRAHCRARHQSIVTSMQPLWGIIIWSIRIHTAVIHTVHSSSETQHACIHSAPPQALRLQPSALSPSPSPSLSVHHALIPADHPQTSAPALNPQPQPQRPPRSVPGGAPSDFSPSPQPSAPAPAPAPASTTL